MASLPRPGPARCCAVRPAGAARARDHPLASEFKDYFSDRAAAYAEFRPVYPDALYQWLAAQAPSRAFAWDAATGNGQAALALARYFERVLASDASPSQLEHAEPHPRVSYRVAIAGHDPRPPRDVDLVTVAQALHWLDRPRFFEEARGALRPGGIIAAWSYALCRIDPAVDAVVDRLHNDLLHGWWTPDRALVDEGYRSLVFPFRELRPPAFEMTSRWDLVRFRGYLGTWSAVRRFLREAGRDPLEGIAAALADAWGEPARVREVTWPLAMRVGVKD